MAVKTEVITASAYSVRKSQDSWKTMNETAPPTNAAPVMPSVHSRGERRRFRIRRPWRTRQTARVIDVGTNSAACVVPLDTSYCCGRSADINAIVQQGLFRIQEGRGLGLIQLHVLSLWKAERKTRKCSTGILMVKTTWQMK